MSLSFYSPVWTAFFEPRALRSPPHFAVSSTSLLVHSQKIIKQVCILALELNFYFFFRSGRETEITLTSAVCCQPSHLCSVFIDTTCATSWLPTSCHIHTNVLGSLLKSVLTSTSYVNLLLVPFKLWYCCPGMLGCSCMLTDSMSNSVVLYVRGIRSPSRILVAAYILSEFPERVEPFFLPDFCNLWSILWLKFLWLKYLNKPVKCLTFLCLFGE